MQYIHMSRCDLLFMIFCNSRSHLLIYMKSSEVHRTHGVCSGSVRSSVLQHGSWQVCFGILPLFFFFFGLLGNPFNLYKFLSSSSMPCATQNITAASLDMEDVALSSGEAISFSVATTISVSQPMFTVSRETLSRAFSQALGQSFLKV